MALQYTQSLKPNFVDPIPPLSLSHFQIIAHNRSIFFKKLFMIYTIQSFIQCIFYIMCLSVVFSGKNILQTFHQSSSKTQHYTLEVRCVHLNSGSARSAPPPIAKPRHACNPYPLTPTLHVHPAPTGTAYHHFCKTQTHRITSCYFICTYLLTVKCL